MNIVLVVGTIVVYMVGMIAIGVSVSKKNKSTDVFYLGVRQLGPFVTAMSAEASDMSSWLLMGLPGVALFGVIGGGGTFAEAFWTAAGLAVGTYLNWLIVANLLESILSTLKPILFLTFSQIVTERRKVYCWQSVLSS